jgi:hypothetical protein
MSEGSIRIYDPTIAASAARGATIVARLGALSGKTVGVIWNNKRPGDALLEELQRQLTEQYGAVPGPMLMKPYLGNVAPDEIFEQLESCDAVVTGIGDCGSCMSATVLDAIVMERHGVPSVALGTERLASTTGKGMARFHGLPDFPIVMIRDRVRLEGVRDADERKAIVKEILPRIVAGLINGSTD